MRDQGAREIKEHGGDGLRGVSKEKSTGESGRLTGIPIPQADSVTVGRENKLYKLRDKPLCCHGLCLVRIGPSELIWTPDTDAEEYEDRCGRRDRRCLRHGGRRRS